MSRFDLDLSEVATEGPLVPRGFYPARITKSSIQKGESEKCKHGVWANLNLSLAINDPEVSAHMGVDNPTVFWSGSLNFDGEGTFLKSNCPDIGMFIKITGFTDINDFLEGTDEIEDNREAMLKVFENMGEASIGTDLMCKIVHDKHYQDPDRMVHKVSAIAGLEDED